MREIPLTQGKVALVDEDDYLVLSLVKWNYTSWGYAAKNLPREPITRKQKKMYMHRIIISCPKGMEVDHINGDKLDNRKQNLRICTTAQNAINKSLSRRNKVGVKGVYWIKKEQRWTAYIGTGGKNLRLKSFKTLDEAIACRKEAEKKYHGEFSRGAK